MLALSFRLGHNFPSFGFRVGGSHRGLVSEEKLRLVKEERARIEAERSKSKEPGGLSPENLKKIEEALNLM